MCQRRNQHGTPQSNTVAFIDLFALHSCGRHRHHIAWCKMPSFFYALILRSMTDVVCQESVRIVTASRGARRAPGSSPQRGQREGETTNPMNNAPTHIVAQVRSTLANTLRNVSLPTFEAPCLSFFDDSVDVERFVLFSIERKDSFKFDVNDPQKPSGPEVCAAVDRY